jgi:hypothetical protein
MLQSWWLYACCCDVSLKTLLILFPPSVNCRSCKSRRFLQLTHKDVLFYIYRRQPIAATGINHASCHFFWGGWGLIRSIIIAQFHGSASKLNSRNASEEYFFWLPVGSVVTADSRKENVPHWYGLLSASLWRHFQVPPTCSWGLDLMGYCAASVGIFTDVSGGYVVRERQ